MRAKQLRRQIERKLPRGRLCAALLASSLMLGGCAENIAARLPETPAKVETVHEYVWKPAFMIKKDSSGFSIDEISFGLKKEVLEDVSGDDRDLYRIPSDIPDSERKKHRKILEQHLPLAGMLRVGRPEIAAMMENNIYLVSPGTIGGAYVNGAEVYSELPHMLFDRNGKLIDSDPEKHVKNIVLLGERTNITLSDTAKYVFIHEHLHDAWAEIVTEDDYAPVLSTLQLLFERGGEKEDRIALLLHPYSLTFGHGDGQDMEFASPKLCEKSDKGMIRDFAEENFPEAGRDDVIAALEWYLSFRARMHYKLTDHRELRKETTRKEFIWDEGYPRLFDFGIIPPFMRHLYSPVLTGQALDGAMYSRESSHLQSVEKIEAFVPVIEKFMGYAEKMCSAYMK